MKELIIYEADAKIVSGIKHQFTSFKHLNPTLSNEEAFKFFQKQVSENIPLSEEIKDWGNSKDIFVSLQDMLVYILNINLEVMDFTLDPPCYVNFLDFENCLNRLTR